MSEDTLIVTHTLALDGAVADRAVEVLLAVEGVVAVTVGKDGASLSATWNLRHTSLTALEDELTRAGIPMARGAFHALRRGWIKFTDDNLLGNATSPGHGCCNRPPPGAPGS